MNKFTHLHVHTQYSILDGMSDIGELVDKCLANGMNAMAVTDHGVMYGIKEFSDVVGKKNGKVKDEIKALLIRHGADRLTEIDPSEYDTMMEEAEGIGK